jgi:hypothetical protein
MKNIIDMVLNAMVNILGDGLIMIANIEGMDKLKDAVKHINANVRFYSHVWYFITTSDMHQKLGTFNWYNPR